VTVMESIRKDDLSSDEVVMIPLISTGSRKRVCNRGSSSSSPSPWSDIFACSKLVLSMEFNTGLLCIRFVDDKFLLNFRYTSEKISNRTLEVICGPGTSQLTISRLKTSVTESRTFAEYINFYRSDRVPLSCHITNQVILGNTCREQSSSKYEDEASEIIMILSIRSASVVGNASFCGIGLLPFTKEELKKKILSDIAEAAKKNKM